MQASVKPDSLNVVTGKKMSNPHRSKDERGLLIYYQHIVNHLSVNHKFWINISNATDMPPYQTAAKCYTHKFLKRLLLLTPNLWFSSYRPLGVQSPSHLGMWDSLLAHTCSRTPGCPGCPPLRVGHSPREVTPHHKSAGPEVAPCWMWMSWRQHLGCPWWGCAARLRQTTWCCGVMSGRVTPASLLPCSSLLPHITNPYGLFV